MPSTGFDDSRDGELFVPGDDVRTLVSLIFASAYSYFEFGVSLFKIEFQRNQSEPFQFRRFAHLLDFGDVREQFALALGFVPESFREKIFVDVRADQPEFVFVFGNFDPGFAEAAFASPDGFDFGTDEYNADFKAAFDKVEVLRFAIDYRRRFGNILILGHIRLRSLFFR